jgi:hypothetical protein
MGDSTHTDIPAGKTPSQEIPNEQQFKAESLTEMMEGSKASQALTDAVRKTLDKKKRERDFSSAGSTTKVAERFKVVPDRYEAKYIIPRRLLPQIREFIRPFCQPDPHGKGDPPEYVITTLQLDSSNLVLHKAKYDEALYRFKLRIRTYGEPGSAPVFLEVKKKFRQTIIKARCVLPYHLYSEEIFHQPTISLPFKNKKDELGYLEFRRLVHEIGAKPVLLIRYIREAYFGVMDHYARVSFDRKLQYQPTTLWTGFGKDRRWLSMDTPSAQNKEKEYSGLVMEIKTLADAPQWMLDLVTEFDLVRTGNCKYSCALSLESLFRGTPMPPDYEPDYVSAM